MFNAPLDGAAGILFNIKGGKDLTLGQVHEVAEIIRKAARSDANVIFGVVQDKKMKKRVSITLVATGVNKEKSENSLGENGVSLSDAELAELINGHSANGLASVASGTRRLL